MCVYIFCMYFIEALFYTFDVFNKGLSWLGLSRGENKRNKKEDEKGEEDSRAAPLRGRRGSAAGGAGEMLWSSFR